MDKTSQQAPVVVQPVNQTNVPSAPVATGMPVNTNKNTNPVTPNPYLITTTGATFSNSVPDPYMMLAFQLGYTVKIIAYTHLFLQLIGLVFSYNLLYLISTVFPIIGLYSAYKYHRNSAIIYLIFNLLQILFYGVNMVASFMNSDYTWVLSIIGIIVHIYFSVIIYKYIQILDKLNNEKITSLRNGNLRLETRFVWTGR